MGAKKSVVVRREIGTLPLDQGQGAAVQGARSPLQEDRDGIGRLQGRGLGVLVIGEGGLIHGDAQEDAYRGISRGFVLISFVVEAEGNAFLVDRIGGGKGMLAGIFPIEGGQDVQVFVTEPGVADLHGESGGVSRNGPDMDGLEDAGVQEAQEVDADPGRVRDGLGLIGNQYPTGGGNVIFPFVADDGHLRSVVGREDARGEGAGFDAGIGI